MTHCGYRTKTCLFTVAGLAALLGAAPALAGPYDSWMYRAQISFTGYSKSETLTNFPALVVLGTNISGFAYTQFQSVSNDLAFTDSTGATNLNYQIDKWDTNGSSRVWVQVPALVNGTAILAFWGATNQTAPAGTGATWSNGYAAVYHLGETGAPRHDSAGVDNALTSSGSSAVSPTNGVIGDAGYFPSDSNYLTTPDQAELDGMNRLTLEGWAYTLVSDTTARAIVSKRTSSTSGYSYTLFVGIGTTAGALVFDVNNSSAGRHQFNIGFPTGTWVHVAAVFDPAAAAGTRIRIYTNGVQAGVADDSSSSVADTTSSLQLGEVGGNANTDWRGKLDEVRVSNLARSSNWIWACWMNSGANATNFQTYGSAAQRDINLPIIANLAASNVTTGSAFMNASLLNTGTSTTAVTLYWGTTDAGTNLAGWANTNLIDPAATGIGSYTTNVAGLSPGIRHFYTYAANNASGTVCATPSISLLTLGAPSVRSTGVASNSMLRATLQGQVTGGNPTPQVYVCWGTVDAGTSGGTGAWQNVASAGTTSGDFAVTVNGLTELGPYFFRCYATNTLGDGWSAARCFMEGRIVAVKATPYIPTNTSYGSLDASIITAITNGTIAVYSNALSDAVVSTGDWAGARWRNYGTSVSGGGSDYLFYKFDLSVLPRFTGGTVNRAQMRTFAGSGNTGSASLDCITRSWTEGNKASEYPGVAPAARGVSGAHPNGINSSRDQNSEGGTSVPVQSWGPNSNAVFTLGTDTSGTLIPGTRNYPAHVYPVTDIVGRWQSQTATNYGFCISDNGNYGYYLRENGTYTEPVLFIDYTPADDFPLIANLGGASNITYATADLYGRVASTGSAPTEVYVFWGTQDKYPNVTGWDGSLYLGTQSIGNVVGQATGLAPGTRYAFRFYATNTFGAAWAAPATVFDTISATLAVNNAGGATGTTAFASWVNGTLVSTGGAPAAVWVYFGTNSATGGPLGTDKSLWLTNYYFGSGFPDGTPLTARFAELSQTTTYYYSYYASNNLGNEVWAGLTNFQTLAAAEYEAKADAAWDAASTWTPSTDYPRNPDDVARIASNTVSAGAYLVPAVRLIDLTTNATGSATGTLAVAIGTPQTAPIQMNGGTLRLDVDGNNGAGAISSNGLTVKAASQIYQVGVGNHNVACYGDCYGTIQDWVQGGVTNTGMITISGSDCAGLTLRAANGSFSGGWDILGGPAVDGSARGGVRLYKDGCLGTGTTILRNRMGVYLGGDQTSAPTPARVIMTPGSEICLDKQWPDGTTRTVKNWDIEVHGGTMSFGAFGSSAYVGGHLYMTSNCLFYGFRDYRSWGPDHTYGGVISGNGRLTIDAQRSENGWQAYHLSGDNAGFSGGVTVLWNALYVEHANALGTGDCWFSAPDANGGVYLRTTPATTNWLLQNNFGGISNITVQTGSSAYTLTVPGKTVQPGTSVNRAGQLAIVGSLAFGTDPAGNSSTLILDVSGTNGVAGVDFDRLLVSGSLANLNHAALVVNIATNLAKDALVGQELIVVSNATSLASTFTSVTFQGKIRGAAWRGNVTYNQPAGTVKLSHLVAAPSGAAIFFM